MFFNQTLEAATLGPPNRLGRLGGSLGCFWLNIGRWIRILQIRFLARLTAVRLAIGPDGCEATESADAMMPLAMARHTTSAVTTRTFETHAAVRTKTRSAALSTGMARNVMTAAGAATVTIGHCHCVLVARFGGHRSRFIKDDSSVRPTGLGNGGSERQDGGKERNCNSHHQTPGKINAWGVKVRISGSMAGRLSKHGLRGASSKPGNGFSRSLNACKIGAIRTEWVGWRDGWVT